MADKPDSSPNLAEVISPLLEMAIVMHETYSAFMSAGFSEDQSLQLVMGMADMMGNNTDELDDND